MLRREGRTAAPPEPEVLLHARSSPSASGSGLVFNANSLGQLLWRSHVPGAAGFFNSIRVVNTNPMSDNLKELYIAGSFGLWRFTQAGESSQP